MTGEEFKIWFLGDEVSLFGKKVTEKISIVCGKLGKKHLTSCVFEQDLDICSEGVYYAIFENCSSKAKIEIQANTIGQTIRFDRCSLDSLKIQSSSNAEIDILHSAIDQNLIFLHLTDFYFLRLENLRVKGRINLIGLKGGPEAYVTLTDIICEGRLKVSGYEGNLASIELNQGHYHWIEIGTAISKINFSGEDEMLNVGTIDFIGYNHESQISLQNVRVQDLLMNNIIGDQTSFELLDVTISKCWFMNYSAPEDFVALNLNLTDCEVYFDNTLLANCIFSNMKWPHQKKLHSTEKDPRKASGLLREAYRQLKQAMVKDGNNIDALAFHRNEMDAYRNEISSHRTDGPRVQRIKSFAKRFIPKIGWDLRKGQAYEDRILMWLGDYVSDHGQSFARPIVWLFLFHFILFFILVLCGYNEFSYSWSNASWAGFRYHLGHFFMLLNPAHSVPIEAKNFTDGMLGIDFFMRLSSAFFIYHIIRASRKFAKL